MSNYLAELASALWYAAERLEHDDRPGRHSVYVTWATHLREDARGLSLMAQVWEPSADQQPTLEVR